MRGRVWDIFGGSVRVIFCSLWDHFSGFSLSLTFGGPFLVVRRQGAASRRSEIVGRYRWVDNVSPRTSF